MNAFILKKPVITEKSLMLANKGNTYTFEVARGATKNQVKDAVEKTYGVNVTSVNTIFGASTLVATGRKRLKRPNAKIKKALVTLKDGQKIAVFDITGDNT